MQPTNHNNIKIENNKYYARYRKDGINLDGHRLKVLPPDIDGAILEFLNLKKQYSNPTFKGKSTTVADLYQEYLAYEQKRVDIRKLMPKSFDEKNRIMKNYIVTFFGEMSPKEITASAWLDFCKYFKDVKAFDNQRKVLVNFLKWCQNPENGGYVTYIPIFELPEYEERKGKFLSPEEIHKIYVAMDSIGIPEQVKNDLKDLWRLLELTGCRRMEIQGLSWDKVNFKNKTIDIGNALSRTKQAKTIPIVTAALEILKERKINSNANWVFIDRNNPSSFYNTSYFKNYLRFAVAAAGLNDIQFKDLRTTVANVVDEALKDPTKSSAYLGHSVDVHNAHYNRQQNYAKSAVIDALENREQAEILSPKNSASNQVKLSVVRG